MKKRGGPVSKRTTNRAPITRNSTIVQPSFSLLEFEKGKKGDHKLLNLKEVEQLNGEKSPASHIGLDGSPNPGFFVDEFEPISESPIIQEEKEPSGDTSKGSMS